MSQKQTINLYTDGACLNNPGKGGWGVYGDDGQKSFVLSGGEADTTNNRMELRAAIEGLRHAAPYARVRLFTDSKYVMMGVTEWINKWKINGWRTASKKPVKNKDLWITLDALCAKRQHGTLKWQWIKGHSGNPGNEKADLLARKAAELA